MWRILCILFAGFVFVAAFSVGRSGPTLAASPAAFGYYGFVALMVAFGVLCLFLPDIFRFLFAPRAVQPALTDVTFSGGNRWHRADTTPDDVAPTEFVPSPFAAPITALIALGLLAVPVFYWRDVIGGVEGPRAVSAAELSACTDANDLPARWVKVTPDKVVDPGVSFSRKRKYAPPEKTNFVLLQVGDKYLIARTTDAHRKYKGRLGGPTTPGAWGKEIDSVAEVKRKCPQVADRLLPFELACQDDSDARMNAFVAPGLCVALALFPGWLSINAIRVRRNRINERS